MTLHEPRPILGSVDVSFEFFPPKNEQMQDALWSCVNRLAPLSPRFMSVTYGAGGTTRERTHDTVTSIARKTGVEVAAHLTCVKATREDVNAVARAYWQAGIRHVVALRGDPPEGQSDYVPYPGGYAYAVDLVSGLKGVADFDISVAAYPEGHPQARSLEDDLDNLKRKVDAGASRAITQYFFEAGTYLRFCERAERAGLTVPIIPGILPVTNFAQVVKFSKMCGASVPSWLRDRFEGLDDDPDTRRLIAAATAAELCETLQRNGVRHFHFYTLNRADLVFAICHFLGIRPVKAVTAP